VNPGTSHAFEAVPFPGRDRKGAAAGQPLPEPLIHASPYNRIRAFLWFRIAIAGALFALCVTTDLTGFGETGLASRGGSLLLLLAAAVFSGTSALGLRWRASLDLLAMMQVAWDLAFSVIWIYVTGGTESPFL